MHDHVAEAVAVIVQRDPVVADLQVMPQPPLVAEPLGRDHHQTVVQLPDRLRVLVPEGLPDQVRRPRGGAQLDHDATSAHTVIDLNAAGPKVVIIATSRASRPRPISTLPTRRALLRGSNVHHLSPRYTSIQAAKSIGLSGGSTYRSGR